MSLEINNTNIKTSNIDNALKTTHPCINCGNPCFGSQCKSCHLKMITERLGDCSDCSKKFAQVRKDGSKRKRCQKCQEIYNNKYISICKKCDKTYHSTLSDGRIFDSCFDCYKDSFHKCQHCDNRIKDKFIICGDCFHKEKEEKRIKIENAYQLNDCKTTDCTNKTTYSLCKTCHEDIRSLEDRYIVSTCQEPGCGYRSLGNFKFCTFHRKRTEHY